jgi:hypothetical protein
MMSAVRGVVAVAFGVVGQVSSMLPVLLFVVLSDSSEEYAALVHAYSIATLLALLITVGGDHLVNEGRTTLSRYIYFRVGPGCLVAFALILTHPAAALVAVFFVILVGFTVLCGFLLLQRRLIGFGLFGLLRLLAVMSAAGSGAFLSYGLDTSIVLAVTAVTLWVGVSCAAPLGGERFLVSAFSPPPSAAVFGPFRDGLALMVFANGGPVLILVDRAIQGFILTDGQYATYSLIGALFAAAFAVVCVIERTEFLSVRSAAGRVRVVLFGWLVACCLGFCAVYLANGFGFLDYSFDLFATFSFGEDIYFAVLCFLLSAQFFVLVVLHVPYFAHTRGTSYLGLAIASIRANLAVVVAYLTCALLILVPRGAVSSGVLGCLVGLFTLSGVLSLQYIRYRQLYSFRLWN